MVEPIDDQIRRAIESGTFDNLPGQGKPLNLEENPFENPDWRLAHHVLRNAGFTLPWIELRREIEDEQERARAVLEQAWRQSGRSQNPWTYAANGEWERAEQSYRRQVDALNRRILDYNLQAPSRFHLRSIHPETVIEEFKRKLP